MRIAGSVPRYALVYYRLYGAGSGDSWCCLYGECAHYDGLSLHRQWRSDPTTYFAGEFIDLHLAVNSSSTPWSREPVSRAEFKVQGFASLHEITADRFNIRLANAGGLSVIELLAYEYYFGVNPTDQCPVRVREALRQLNRKNGISDLALLDGQPAPPPAILVGIDQLYKIKIPEAPLTVINNVLAFKTVFGWTIGGPEQEVRRTELPYLLYTPFAAGHYLVII